MHIKTFAKKYFGITLAKHQLEWIKFLETSGKKCLLLAPRGHGKTTTVNLIYLTWLIANDPTLNILVVSHSKEMAESFSRSIRNVFEQEDIQHDFGIEPGSPWRANSWTLKGAKQAKPTLRVIGAMGRMTGWRGDIVIFDDLLEINAVASEATRNKIDNWIKSEVFPALDPGPKQRIIVVGTRKHINDWYGELLKNADFKCRVDKCWDENMKPLWPKRYTVKELESIKRLNGALYFAQEFLNEPSPPGGLTFKTEWLNFYEHLPNRKLIYYIGIDPSHGSKEKRSTYFAYAVVAHDIDKNKIYIVELYRGKLSKEEQIQKSIDVVNRYDMRTIFVETVFEYTHVYDSLKKMFPNVRPIDYVHTKIKGTTVLSKEERIQNIPGPMFETGRLILKNTELDYFTKLFVEQEYVPFPHGDMDIFDAITLATHHLKKRKIIDRLPLYFPRG